MFATNPWDPTKIKSIFNDWHKPYVFPQTVGEGGEMCMFLPENSRIYRLKIVQAASSLRDL
jgi:hypothetical protein